MKEDRELAEYRDLLAAPTTFADGFSVRSVIGCIFIGLVMMPASMYLSLLAGSDLSGAARWVTVILFVELARRSFTTLKQPEIFILFYMAGAAISSPFSGLLWNQYYATAQTVAQHGIHLPAWVAPSRAVIDQRTFFSREWLAPIGMIVLAQVLGRLDNFGLGYVLFRITSDVEKLPFPMAPVGALGITALAESSADSHSGNASSPEQWKWRVFAIGGMIGLAFGFLYVGIPALSSTFLKSPIQILPVTFFDFTQKTDHFLPATPITLSADLGNILLGMVLPFFAVIGSFLGMIVTWIANPILHATGQLPHWTPGMNAYDTEYATRVDVYLSIGIGLAMAIAIVGFYHVFVGLRQKKQERRRKAEVRGQEAEVGARKLDERSAWQRLIHPPAGRGDIPLWAGVAIYLFSTTTYISVSHFLVPNFPVWILLAYGFVYTPIISYVAARMEGVAGQWVEIPMVREATFIASQSLGYRGVDIWFAPIPLHNYAGQVVAFRTQELTGTKFTSIIKAELVIFPVIIISSIIFAQYLWRIAPIPSAVYPYANQMWEQQARMTALMQSSTLGNAGGTSEFYQAIKPVYIVSSTAAGVGIYALLASLGAPVMLCYGLVRGLGSGIAAGLFPQLIGAILARYLFEKRLGLQWRQYAPVLLAGFSCGVGLISMFSLGCLLISKAVFQLPY